ncbi:hypothetical protein BDZ45DRAFT_185766 [Acephala macrosclerotiorum]|nr:hypothetical protein BDZ45DRAFT_185766 [Acephala macrosclerotiorum]
MAGAIGRVTAALATVHNENSAALANFNFDFTLIKREAPVEYSAVGATISRKRKIDAEEGRLHKTARKLGALFEGSLPRTEKLFRSYGKRVSEISSIPSINPRDGLDRGGFFANHVGAETTSIWAAVTSGSAAIAVHLLGCMLARMFPSSEAISIWTELVQKQKAAIIEAEKDVMYAEEQYSSMSATRQEIARAELASWDASARAWLQSADQAKELQHKQTMLIIENTSLPVNNNHNTHASVLKAWTSALQAMDNLLAGIPQRVQDGAILLAISSWHLYPDMAVYGASCVEAKQKDSLFDPAALLTVGLEHSRDDAKGVYWSLPLACLQYYGQPVETSRTVSRENSRVNYQEFAYIILGCLFHGWKAFAVTNDEGVKWILQMSRLLKVTAHSRSARQETDLRWLRFLLQTAERFSEAGEAETKIAHQLMNLGRRRSAFFHAPSSAPLPLFGLSQVEIMLPILQDEEERIIFLRRLAPHLSNKGESCLIKYRYTAPDGELKSLEWATIYPKKQTSGKRTHDGQLKISEEPSFKHVRWINLSYHELSFCLKQRHYLTNVPFAVEQLQYCEAFQRNEHPSLRPHLSPDDHVAQWREEFSGMLPNEKLEVIQRLKAAIHIGKRLLAINAKGEQCLPAVSITDHSSLSLEIILRSHQSDFFTAAQDLFDNIYEQTGESSRVLSRVFHAFFIGDADLASIVSTHPELFTDNPRAFTYSMPLSVSRLVVEPKFLEEILPECVLDTRRLERHFSTHLLAMAEASCLTACFLMTEVYKLLPGASISTLVVNQCLAEAKWIPVGNTRPEALSLPQTFACIAMFETGTFNLSPQALVEVFAMSSGNSLYIARALLCDPYEEAPSAEVQRVIGNVGRAGTTFLISPPEVKERSADPERWMAINHNPFNGKLENHFTQTSMHLSFTEYEISLMTEDTPRHIIDRAAFLVETLVSLYDGGQWVSEVDVLKALRSQVRRVTCQDPLHSNQLVSVQNLPELKYRDAVESMDQLHATSIENWDELIEAPDRGVIVIRAHKNWLARLAALAVCVRRNFLPIILPDEPCWKCCAELIYSSQKMNDRIALIC